MNHPQTDRWAWVEVDLDAIRHNAEQLCAIVAPSELWAVVKANGYGHGAADVARAALDGGASGLCVALAGEGVTLRDAGIDAPILVLSQQPAASAATIVEHRLTPTVYSTPGIRAIAEAAAAAGAIDLPVHVKIDTGMHRVGAAPDELGALVDEIRQLAPALRLGGIFTHLAVADDPADPFTTVQLDRLERALAAHDISVADVAIHAANSAGALAHHRARYTLVRVGIALYGLSPGAGVEHLAGGLRPAMSVRARVSFVKRVRAGERVSYGLRHTFDRDTTVATVPLGYADGVPRRLSAVGGEVLIGGRRRPIVGVVTMDQLMVDCGDDPVTAGQDVVLIGSQTGPAGVEAITADEIAARLDTIGYEIVCGVSGRMPRIRASTPAPSSIDV